MKTKVIVAITSLIVSILLASTSVSAYTVRGGDTLWKISQMHGVTLDDLRQANNKWDNNLNVGDYLEIPLSSTISVDERDMLARLVEAEAKGEPYAGKVAVATVVLNRVDSPDFPDTIRGVIYETYENGKYYAFSPVQNGEINKPASAESIKAVVEAIGFRGQGGGSLFFYNPKTSTSKWILSRPVTVVIGNHTFAK